jgi:hypothetical protein
VWIGARQLSLILKLSRVTELLRGTCYRGKNTGFVLVCSGRQVYHQYWSVVIEWLTELPESIHYEDRKGVIKFCQAIFKIHEDEQWDVASGVQDGYSDGWVKRRARRIDDDEDTCGK